MVAHHGFNGVASEVCGLKLADLDLKAGSIVIRRLRGSLQTTQPSVPALRAAVRAWLRVRHADGSDFLFTSEKGGRFDRTQFFRIFQSVAEAVCLSPRNGIRTASSTAWRATSSPAT